MSEILQFGDSLVRAAYAAWHLLKRRGPLSAEDIIAGDEAEDYLERQGFPPEVLPLPDLKKPEVPYTEQHHEQRCP